jgi:serine/threonine protein kinase
MDVLHKCGLVHGDLETDNVLIFRDRKKFYVAKVASFGLSVADAALMSNPSIGGALGWQAPEVKLGKLIPREFLALTNNYLFGLLTWSVMLLNGNAPPEQRQGCRDILAKEHMRGLRNELPVDVWCLVFR